VQWVVIDGKTDPDRAKYRHASLAHAVNRGSLSWLIPSRTVSRQYQDAAVNRRATYRLFRGRRAGADRQTSRGDSGPILICNGHR